jgi:hypothetical protein
VAMADTVPVEDVGARIEGAREGLKLLADYL